MYDPCTQKNNGRLAKGCGVLHIVLQRFFYKAWTWPVRKIYEISASQIALALLLCLFQLHHGA